MHLLNINIKNSSDCRILVLEDSSIWDSSIPIDNILLEIKPPGQKCFKEFELFKGWCSFILNCSLLEICCETNPCEFSIIPDGIYEIRYSVNPNSKTVVEFSHMRVCQLMKSYMKVLCNYYSNKCSRSNKENTELEKELIEIKDTIDASAYAVEECLNNELGLELYEQASNKLKKIDNGSFTKCCK